MNMNNIKRGVLVQRLEKGLLTVDSDIVIGPFVSIGNVPLWFYTRPHVDLSLMEEN